MITPIQRGAIPKRVFCSSNTPYNCDVQDINVSWFDAGKYSVEKDGVEDGSEGVFEKRPLDGLKFEGDGRHVGSVDLLSHHLTFMGSPIRTTSTGNVTGW